MPETLVIVHVHARVAPGGTDAFRAASIANARSSREEPGVDDAGW
jgi:quinol monooxygenase YgiN